MAISLASTSWRAPRPQQRCAIPRGSAAAEHLRRADAERSLSLVGPMSCLPAWSLRGPQAALHLLIPVVAACDLIDGAAAVGGAGARLLAFTFIVQRLPNWLPAQPSSQRLLGKPSLAAAVTAPSSRLLAPLDAVTLHMRRGTKLAASRFRAAQAIAGRTSCRFRPAHAPPGTESCTASDGHASFPRVSWKRRRRIDGESTRSLHRLRC